MVQLGVLFISLEFLLLGSLTFYIGVVNNPNIAINLSYNAIRYYSKLQFHCKKLKKGITNLIKNNPELNKFFNEFIKNNKQNDVDIVKNGNIILSTNKNKLINEPSIIPEDYDFIVYSDHTSIDCENTVLHKKIFRTIPKSLEEFDYEKVDYKFIMMEVIINEKSLSVELSNDKYNYLIVNNMLDEKFIKYYLKKYLCHEIEGYDETHFDDYTLKYIDHNINMCEVDKTQTILITSSDVFLKKEE